MNDNTGTAAPRARTVLIVDDSGLPRRLLVRCFSENGCRVIQAANGVEALRRVQEGPIDLIVLDMQMPELDGFETAKALRQLNYSTPIIAYTGLDDPAARRRCLGAGCTAFVSKQDGEQAVIAAATKLLV